MDRFKSPLAQVTYSSHREAGFTLRREHADAGTSVLLGLVAAGLGIAPVPGGVRAFPMESVAYHELPEADPLELVLAYRAGGDNSVVEAALPLLADF